MWHYDREKRLEITQRPLLDDWLSTAEGRAPGRTGELGIGGLWQASPSQAARCDDTSSMTKSARFHMH